MAKLTNTIATLLAGAAVGVAVGYLLATDKDKRQDDMDKLKKGINNLKDKFAKNAADLEEEIYHT
jgi:gas vesicle protein